MPQTICKNCGNEFDGKFCNNCGQKASTERLTYKSLGESLMHGFLHVDKGIFFTIRILAVNPGKIVSDYINGKRINYFQPFPLLIILSTIYGLLDHILINTKVDAEKAKITLLGVNNNVLEVINYVANHLSQNYALINIFIIPPFILAVRVAFRKAGANKYNFVEYLYGGAYLSSLYILISFVFLPIECILKKTAYFSIWDNVTYIAYFLVTMRFFYQLFEGSIWKAIKRTIYAYTMYIPVLAIYVLILTTTAIGLIYLWHNSIAPLLGLH